MNGRETHQFDVHGVGVCFTVNSYGLDAELSCCSNDPTCDLTTIRKELLKRFGVRVIGDAPVGYKDLVEVRVVMRWALEMVRLVTNTSSHSAPEDTKKCCSPVVAKCLVTPERLGQEITDGLLTAEEVGGTLVAAWAESICRLFRPEAVLRER